MIQGEADETAEWKRNGHVEGGEVAARDTIFPFDAAVSGDP
jgi:hypothetical protein